jgi:hypothetical protein
MLTTPSQSDSKPIECLRQLKYLTVVDVDLEEEKDYEPPDAAGWENARKIWKRKLIDLLRDSPSTERKFLRWKISQSYPRADGGRGRAYDVVESEELEVLLETSL